MGNKLIILFFILSLGAFSEVKSSKKKTEKYRPNICLILFNKVIPRKAINYQNFKGTSNTGVSYLDEISYRGLRHLLRYDETQDIIFETMMRIGLLSKKSEDDHTYIEWILISENKPINLASDKNHHEEIINDFIENRKKHFFKDLKQIKVLGPLSEIERQQILMELIVKTFNPALMDENSKKALASYFTNIERIFERHLGPEKMPKSELIRKVKDLSKGLQTYAIYSPKEFLDDNPNVKAALFEIPLFGTIYKALNFFYLIHFRKSIQQMQKFLPVGKNQIHYKMRPNSMRLFFENRDPFGLDDQVEAFIKKYTDPKNSSITYSKEFERDLLKSYPELSLVMSHNFEQGYVVDDFYADGIFGPGAVEYYKVTKRMALIMALIQGNYRVFPGLSEISFQRFRKQILNDLDIIDVKGDIDIDKLDFFLTLLMLDTIGRGGDFYLNHLNSKMNHELKYASNFEKKAAALLKLDPFISFSVAKQENFDQERLISLADAMGSFNFGHMNLGMVGKNSIRKIVGLPKEETKLLLGRFFITMGALGEDPNSKEAHLINENTYGLYRLLNKLIFDYQSGKRDLDETYKMFISYKAYKFGLIKKNEPELVTAEVVALTRLSSLAKAEGIKDVRDLYYTFHNLSDSHQKALVKFLNSSPAISYSTSKLLKKIKLHNKEDSFEIWLQVLAEGYIKVMRHRAYHGFILQQRDNGEIPIHFDRLGSYLDEGADPLDLITEEIVTIVNSSSFQLHISKFE